MDLVALGIGIVFTGLGGISAVQTARMYFSQIMKIAVAQGNATIFGTVSSENPILSPITKTPCVYCAYRTFQRGAKFRSGTTLPHSKPRGTAQVMAGTGVKHADFYLEDETGKLFVLGQAQLFGNSKNEITCYDDSSEYADKIKEFKLSIGEGEDRQYEEDLVREGDELYVHGTVTNENGRKIMHPDSFSYRSIKKVASSPIGIIVTIILLALGIYNLFHAMVV